MLLRVELGLCFHLLRVRPLYMLHLRLQRLLDLRAVLELLPKGLLGEGSATGWCRRLRGGPGRAGVAGAGATAGAGGAGRVGWWREEGHAVDGTSVALEGVDGLARAEVPQPYGVVLTPGEGASAVG